MILPFLNQWLGLIIDTGLVFGFFFLWLSWHRNGKRQQQLEQLLGETARQLEEATRHLSEATEAIKHLQQQEKSSARRPEAAKHSRVAQSPAKQAPAKLPQARPSAPPAQNSTQATMILRMKREGESPQTIAERLDMPLAQVKLLLKLHAASSPDYS